MSGSVVSVLLLLLMFRLLLLLLFFFFFFFFFSSSALLHNFEAIFSKTPMHDPYLKSKEHTAITSAEACATGVRNMCYGLRRIAIYPDRRSSADYDCFRQLIDIIAAHEDSLRSKAAAPPLPAPSAPASASADPDAAVPAASPVSVPSTPASVAAGSPPPKSRRILKPCISIGSSGSCHEPLADCRLLAHALALL